MNDSILWHQDPPFVADYMNFYMDKTKVILGTGSTAAKIKVLGATNGPIPLKVGSRWFVADTDYEITIATALDTGSVEAGKDYYVYICDNNGVKAYVVSLNSTYPSGYSATTSRKIGGFHTLCADVGTISGHPFSGYLAGDVHFNSIWDLKHRAKNLDNRGLAYSPSRLKWVQIYLSSDDGAGGVQSVKGATILDTINWDNIGLKTRPKSMHFLSDHDFDSIAEGSNQKTNIAGSTDPVTTGGHSDTAGRRMISYEGFEDCCGALWQWLDTHGYRFDGAANHTHQVTVSGDAQTVTSGNPSGDVAPTWAYRDLGDNRGSFYGQGTFGEIKLLAGGGWSSGALCGSRGRDASYRRSDARASFGGRFAVESL